MLNGMESFIKKGIKISVVGLETNKVSGISTKSTIQLLWESNDSRNNYCGNQLLCKPNIMEANYYGNQLLWQLASLHWSTIQLLWESNDSRNLLLWKPFSECVVWKSIIVAYTIMEANYYGDQIDMETNYYEPSINYYGTRLLWQP